jgi:hypothetical protein
VKGAKDFAGRTTAREDDMGWNMAGKSEKGRMRDGEEEEKYIGPLSDRRGVGEVDLLT